MIDTGVEVGFGFTVYYTVKEGNLVFTISFHGELDGWMPAVEVLEQVISHGPISCDKCVVHAAFPNSWSVTKGLEGFSFKDFHVKVGDDSGNWTSHASTFLLFTERSFIPEAHVPQNDVQEFGDQ